MGGGGGGGGGGQAGGGQPGGAKGGGGGVVSLSALHWDFIACLLEQTRAGGGNEGGVLT